MEFGERLKKERLKMGFTQDQVANHFFVSRQTISSWENEKSYPDINSLIKLSDYYQISLDTLLKKDSGMKEYLEKKEVVHSLKPTYVMLVINDVLFLCLLFLRYFNLLPIGHLAYFLLYVIGIINAFALSQMSVFQRKIIPKRIRVHFTHRRFIIIITILVLGLLFCLFTQQNNIFTGFLSALIFSVVFSYII